MIVKKNSNLVTVVDVGDTKIVCLIAKASHTGEISIIGAGHQISEGFKSGTITDMKALRSSIIAAIYAAEQMASMSVNSVIVNLSTPQTRSLIARAQLDLAGRQILSGDIRKLVNLSLDRVDHVKEDILYFSPLKYDVDDIKNITNPEFMFASSVKIDTCVTTVPNSVLVNMASCFSGCHIKISDFILTSYASAIACMLKDEMTRGSVLIDIGGGSTNICIFEEGHLIFSSTISVGGKNITKDIANFFSINLSEAEKIKVIHGSAVSAYFDEDKSILVKQFSEDPNQEPNSIKSSLLCQVIAARVEEIFTLAKEKMASCGFKNISKKTVILTGGTSQLPSIVEIATNVLNSKVRLGLPRISMIDTTYTRDPAFSTSVGMIKYYYMSEYQKQKHTNKSTSAVGRVIAWLQQNF
jgi:cell division protein FtsA